MSEPKPCPAVLQGVGRCQLGTDHAGAHWRDVGKTSYAWPNKKP